MTYALSALRLLVVSTPTDPLSLAARIRTIREASGLSARTLSVLAGLSHSMISQLENGHVRELGSVKAQRLAVLLGISLDWLIGGDGKTPDLRLVRAMAAAAATAAEAAGPKPKKQRRAA